MKFVRFFQKEYMMRWIPVILSIMLISFTTSCKKKVKLTFDETPEVIGDKEWVEVITPADSVLPQFEYLKAKFRATASLNGSTQSFNTQMRWHKSQKIWLSMSLFGIEGVRVLIDTSAVQWIDKLNQEYHYLPMHKIASKINMDLDFEAIERILLGQPAILDTLPTKVTSSEEWTLWETFHRNGYQSTAIFNRINSMLIEYRAENKTQFRTLTAKYSDVKQVNGGLFPFERMISIYERDASFQMQSKFSEVSVSEELSFPFEVSSKYKKIEY